MNSNIENLQEKTTSENDTSDLFSYIEKINKSFFYAERVLIVSAIVMITGFLFFVLTNFYGVQPLSNIILFETGFMTASLLFILFLMITLFAFAHKLLLDVVLFKKYNLKSPLLISLTTLFLIILSSLMSPIYAFSTILICCLSVGLRIHNHSFIDRMTEISEKTLSK